MRMWPDVESAALLDGQVAEPDHLEAFKPTMAAWSRTVRKVTGLPISSLSKRLNISKQAVAKLEQNEAAGTISIAKLEAIANALDCELVYGFVPKRSFADAAERLQREQDKARKAKRRIPYPD